VIKRLSLSCSNPGWVSWISSQFLFNGGSDISSFVTVGNFYIRLICITRENDNYLFVCSIFLCSFINVDFILFMFLSFYFILFYFIYFILFYCILFCFFFLSHLFLSFMKVECGWECSLFIKAVWNKKRLDIQGSIKADNFLKIRETL
jgi:hypothetical protein